MATPRFATLNQIIFLLYHGYTLKPDLTLEEASNLIGKLTEELSERARNNPDDRHPDWNTDKYKLYPQLFNRDDKFGWDDENYYFQLSDGRLTGPYSTAQLMAMARAENPLVDSTSKICTKDYSGNFEEWEPILIDLFYLKASDKEYAIKCMSHAFKQPSKKDEEDWKFDGDGLRYDPVYKKFGKKYLPLDNNQMDTLYHKIRVCPR